MIDEKWDKKELFQEQIKNQFKYQISKLQSQGVIHQMKQAFQLIQKISELNKNGYLISLDTNLMIKVCVASSIIILGHILLTKKTVKVVYYSILKLFYFFVLCLSLGSFGILMYKLYYRKHNKNKKKYIETF